jgi:hypothetical protein
MEFYLDGMREDGIPMSAEAEVLQREIVRRLGGPSRLLLALDMSVAVRALAPARPIARLEPAPC